MAQKLMVKDVMNGVIFHVNIDESVSTIMRYLYLYNADAVIVRQGGVPKGIITAVEIIKAFVDTNKNPNEMQAKEVMSPIVSIDHDADIDSAKSFMTHQHLRYLPVKMDYDIIGLLIPNDLF
jgi:CBS domain-containing protein